MKLIEATTKNQEATIAAIEQAGGLLKDLAILVSDYKSTDFMLFEEILFRHVLEKEPLTPTIYSALAKTDHRLWRKLLSILGSIAGFRSTPFDIFLGTVNAWRDYESFDGGPCYRFECLWASAGCCRCGQPLLVIN